MSNGWLGAHYHGVRDHDGLSEEKNTSNNFELHLELADSKNMVTIFIPSFFP